MCEAWVGSAVKGCPAEYIGDIRGEGRPGVDMYEYLCQGVVRRAFPGNVRRYFGLTCESIVSLARNLL